MGHMQRVDQSVVDEVIDIPLLGRRLPVPWLAVKPHQMGHQMEHVQLGASIFLETAHALSLANGSPYP